jgi:hypothetical protein
MKVNQIVSEHKKGVRAMKYTKKTKSTVPVYGPDANNAKLKPVKPTGTVTEGEAVIKAIDDKHAELSDPTTGTTFNIDRTNPQGAATLQPDPETGKVKFDPTPEPTSGAAAGGAPNPLTTGAKVEIDVAEAGNDGTAGEVGPPVEPQASPEPDPLLVPGDTVAEARKKDDELLEKMLMIAKLR